MVVKGLKNKQVKEEKIYSFPKEWINIKATSLAEAMKKKAVLLIKRNK